MARKGRNDKGRPRTEGGAPSQVELFEAFCCAQTERIERTLSRRYGMAYEGAMDGIKQAQDHHRAWLMPQNDHMGRHQIETDCLIEWKR